MSELTPADWLWSLRHWSTRRSTLTAHAAGVIASLWEADREMLASAGVMLDGALAQVEELRARIKVRRGVLTDILTALPDSKGIGARDKCWRSLDADDKKYVKKMRRRAEAALREAQHE